MTAAGTPKRVRTAHVAWVRERISEQDLQMLEVVNKLHLVTGWQLDRLFFSRLSPASRTVSRSRVLSRLVYWRVLMRLPRRIGGAKRGSSVAVYAVDTAGQLLLVERANGTSKPTTIRRPGAPSERFTMHILAVSELYVQLREAERSGTLLVRNFQTEPAAWWPNGLGSWLKPDAYLVTSNSTVDHLWWVEVDNATESLPTIDRKLRTYLNFVRRGQLGPRNTIPRVLVTVPTEGRRTAISGVNARMPSPANELFHVVLHEEAAHFIGDMFKKN